MAVTSSKEKKFKKLKFKIKSSHVDEEKGVFTFEGYASKFGGLDSFRETIKPGAYAEDIRENGDKRTALWQHRSSEPIGTFKIKEDSEGLFVIGSLPLDDVFVKGRIVPQLEHGSIDGMSIGFFALEWSFNEEDNITTLEKIELVEISLVTFPADGDARITDLAKAAFSQKWDKKHAEKEINNPELQIAGNLIADKIDGVVQIVPKAVLAARIAMEKSEPTQSEKDDLDKLYISMNMDAPFGDKAKISLDELKNLSKSDRAWAIKNLPLSTNASNFLAELVPQPTKGEEEDPEVKEKAEKEKREKEEKNKNVLSKLTELNNLFSK